MDENTAKIVIAAVGGAGVVIGAAATALASAYTARQKIRELTLQYEQKVEESYLANARQYTQGLYVPLSIELEKLRSAYESFRGSIDLKQETAPAEAISAFRTCIDEYLSAMKELMARGADAFMTGALENRLRSFTVFIKMSRDTAESRRKVIFEYSFSWIGMGAAQRIESAVRGRWARGSLGKLSLRIMGLGIAYREDDVLAAPLCSRLFEESIVSDISELKRLIKEVTLGAQKSGTGA